MADNMRKLTSVISRLFGSGSDTTSGRGDATALQDDQRYFLVIFDGVDQEVMDERAFDDPEEAEAALIDAEDTYRSDQRVQVVMFLADSIDSLRTTHPHYFGERGVHDDDSLMPA